MSLALRRLSVLALFLLAVGSDLASAQSAAASPRPTFVVEPEVTTLNPIVPPLLRPFSDGKNWILGQRLTYNIGGSTESIVVPVGFVTDFASIPQPFWSFGLAPTGKYNLAAIVHDYLYWAQSCSREQSDRLFLLAMKESNVESITRVAVFQGVWLGGKSAWEGNALERAENKPRVVSRSARRLYLTDQAMAIYSWDYIRQTLTRAKVTDPKFPTSPSFCELGNSSEVPLQPLPGASSASRP